MALINSETQSKKVDARQPRLPFREMIKRSIIGPAKTGKHLRRSTRLRVYMLAVVGPTLVVSAYYAFMAAPIYVSEASFVVRMAAPPSSNVFGSLLQNSGITRSQDDTFSVQEYIRSRQALKELTEQLPVRTIFGSRQADWLTRFPRPWENSSEEELYNYYSNRVSVIHNDTTGITVLRTTAFHAQDAVDLNIALLSLGGKLLDRLNDRARGDAVRFADNEVQEAQQRVIDAQKNITNFRNKELMIDPNASSLSMVDLITNLTAELANTRARLAETRKTAPDSNAIPFLTSQIAALEQQIENERAKMVGSDKSVAPRIADYESLVLMREFANKALVAALDSLEAARADARRQQLYLEIVVPSHLPDEAEMPYALKNIAVVFLSLSLAYLLGWLMLTAVRDHESG
ncbi:MULTISPECIES: capsule biosynthesis protein [Rhizobium]|uniref:Capsule biosynthesis protein n=1 Tax=Rhizobium tropici TaxID=398 RepID=A0A329Y5Z4_RHITR|nr:MULTISPECIES: capsule biosynthesis protein [Rhizobium]MBB3285651.1 capsular polysaccharide transport system permease protein [Rhizobium sp. BK252]MBB3400391.1 capsular polysaccharide transport system permease protein [Rhizobium sp. BK289]MBB3412970.1 capsular polysaccharide transport system permease protein [Rhizobium sp. BK284]MBB3480857.1 capsular polysaccharide transport system permease protein [Rhizobium sp. BK347]MDK4721531.1 capsule biosynthesis protein [Rhizobium sp. CNPSo 3968]